MSSSASITILAMPKPFVGHIGIIQRNAINSWIRLAPRPEIIVYGTEAGVAEIAAEFRLVHIPDVDRNRYGTPLLRDIFAKAEARVKNDLLAYVNADIVLPHEFLLAVQKVRSSFPRFLAVGRRTNLKIDALIDFSEGWETKLRNLAAREGELESPTGIDFFVFPRGLYQHVPDLAIGRVWFDQWCIKYARKMGLPVVDLTSYVPAIHQLHEYNHVAGGRAWVYGGTEANENLVLYGERPHAYTILSATHVMGADGRVRRSFFRRELAAMQRFLWKVFVQKTHSVRKRIGLGSGTPK